MYDVIMKNLTPLFVLIFAVSAFAQRPDSWRGVVLDITTPEQAIETLGKPSEDKIDSFRVYKIDDWLTKSIRQKKYRRLEFKGLSDMEKVILAFNDNRLVFIELNPKKLDPDVLEQAYGIKFTATMSKLQGSVTPNNRITGTNELAVYPTVYYLYSTSPTSFLVATVSNRSFGALMGSGSVNDGVGFPGEVKVLQLISRTLENKDGVDVLK